MPVKHNFQSNVADVGIPANLVKPSGWNEDHVLDGMLEQLDSVAVQPESTPYIDAAGLGAYFLISAFMRSLMNSASINALLTSLNAASLESPAFTGVPTAPTAASNNDSTQLATTAFVQAVIANLVGGSPALLDTLNELAAALGNDPNFATTMTNALALKAPLASPALTGTPTAPTATAGDATTKLATTQFVNTELSNAGAAIQGQLDTKAPLASPALTGNPTAPTPAAGDNDTSIATTAFVMGEVNKAQAIANGTDFDTITTEGTYYNTGTCPNTPVAAGLYFMTVRKGNGVNSTSQMAIDVTTAALYTRVRNAGVWTAWSVIGGTLTTSTASLAADVTMPVANTYYDGPSLALAAGKWDVGAVVTVTNTAAATEINWKLWDGTTVIASGSVPISTSTQRQTISTGRHAITNPAGNVRISLRDIATATSKMEFNRSGSSKDCTISATKIG